MTTTLRIDGGKAYSTLLERITSNDAVGGGLALRTKEDYSKKIGLVADKLRAEGQGELSAGSLVSHISTRIANQDCSQSTARSLKAAAMFWLAEQGQIRLDQGRELHELEVAYRRLREMSTRGLPASSKQTSGSKLKYFPVQFVDALVRYASDTPQSKNAGTLVSFIRANLLIGLRPAEWFGASLMSYLHRDSAGQYISDSNGKLVGTPGFTVDNAKATHGRGNGPQRELLLYDVKPDELAALWHFWEIASGFANKMPPGTQPKDLAKAFFKPLQQTMSNGLVRQGFPKMQVPTTYSTRHQVVANAKTSDWTDREVAAFFGHSSTATAKSHYGKKLNGWRKLTFKPSPESISAVQDKTIDRDNAKPGPRVVAAANEWSRQTTTNFSDPSLKGR